MSEDVSLEMSSEGGLLGIEVDFWEVYGASMIAMLSNSTLSLVWRRSGLGRWSTLCLLAVRRERALVLERGVRDDLMLCPSISSRRAGWRREPVLMLAEAL